jgi:hypothetical protein
MIEMPPLQFAQANGIRMGYYFYCITNFDATFF